MLTFNWFTKKRAVSDTAYRSALAAGVCFSGLFLSSAAHAQYTWVGNGTNNRWSDGGNWAGGTPPPVGGDISLLATFTGANKLSNINDRGNDGTEAGTFNLNTLAFDSTAGSYSLSGATFNFSNSSTGTGPTLQVNTGSPITIANNISLANTLTLGTFSGANPTAATSPIGTLTLNGTLSGATTTDLSTRLNSLTLTGGTAGGTNGAGIGGLLVGGVPGSPASVANAFVTNGIYKVSRVSVGTVSSTGALTVSGSSTRIFATNAVNVASSGNGTLTIQNGAQVSGSNIYMGLSSGLTGNATVTGNGSLLSAVGTSPNASLNVAYETGTQSILTLQNGGAAVAVGINIGGVAPGSMGAAGTINVSGPGMSAGGTALAATLQANTMVVGFNNTGTLNISNGGTVTTTNGGTGATSGDVFVGLNAGSAGTITIDSAGSVLTVGGTLSLGGQADPNNAGNGLNGGTASVTLTNGGTLTTVGDTTFYNQGSITAVNSTLNLGGLDSATGTNGGISLTTSTTTTTLTFGSANTNRQFNGVISGSGANVVNKIGTGTEILTAANTYTGTTNINGGTLQVNGSTNASGTVNVNAGGTLAGTGRVGNITEASGGTIAPGQGTGSIGTLQATSLVLNSNANFAYDLNLSSTTSDRLDLSGTLSKLSSASNFNFAFSVAGSLPSGGMDIFTLATFVQPSDPSTKVAVADLRYTGLGANQTGTFGSDAQGFWNGQFTVTDGGMQNMPEPGSLLLMAGGGIAFLPLLRRRRLIPSTSAGTRA